MPKFDKNRNYYADLELGPNASVEDIKKQFKKLAMLYHPDKNVGREAESSLKFQTIQSALEILTDPTLKAQYDDARKNASRFPKASGVRGNPYQDYGKEFARPPTRRQPTGPSRPQPSHSGAQRYKTFAKDMPRTAYSNYKEDPQSRKNNADAWESMRSKSTRGGPQPRGASSTGRETKPPNTSNVPPRTASQQQKAQASFGNRRSGYVPHSPGLGDEAPVPNTNYFTTRTHSSIFDGSPPGASRTNAHASTKPADPTTPVTPDPLAQFREKYWDGRQSTPYQTPGGEKTSLFDDGPSIGRTASTRSPRVPGAYPQSRPRSSSTPRSAGNDSQKMRPQTPERYKPGSDYSGAAGTPTASSKTTKAFAPGRGSVPASDGPSAYAIPPMTSPNAAQPQPGQYSGSKMHARKTHNPAARHPFFTYMNHTYPPSEGVNSGPSSGAKASEERMQARISEHLHSIIRGKNKDKAAETKDTPGTTSFKPAKSSTNKRSYSFTFKNGGSATGREGIPSRSADNINTRFVDDEVPDGWEFSAGSVPTDVPEPPGTSRPASRARVNRRPTMKAKRSQAGGVPPMQENSETAAGSGFSAGQWNDQIGSQHFVPQPSRSPSNSPTRRANLRKSKPVKMTAGTAGLVDEEESEGFLDTSRPSSKTGRVSTDSVNAMDIDSPPPEKVDSTPKAPQMNGARKIPVEPHRAEWRAGDVNGVQPKSTSSAPNGNLTKGPSIQVEDTGATRPAPTPATNPNPNPFAAQHGGSEDTEEFRMSDFAKVEPFVDPAPRGLKDFGDLKSTLPFVSRPSEQIHLERDPTPKSFHLSLPTPPVAPALPPSIAQVGVQPNLTHFMKYVEDFHQYMDKWEDFNSQILGHFTAREANFKSRRQQRGASWINDNSDEYLTELEQDKEVDQWWYTARQNHQAQIREFKLFKERVK
ncbi:hypothetical protein GGR52DRAFT_446467 [Hypoxylon sp. FL1284]|nr:hypothetical protein GGR52DRAFT_446467 [Hypoxylon sp. FL1284]